MMLRVVQIELLAR
jgi:hypothetical protein